MKKQKLLIVGSFPPGNRNIYGGIAKSSEILIQSEYFSKFNIIKLDSSQISNPPPSLPIRLLLSLIRFIRFIFIILFKKPKIGLIFCSDGFSAIEKGLMILTMWVLGIKSLIFPRAGNLISQSQNSFIFQTIIKFLFNKADVFLCQGEKWKKFAVNSLNINPNHTRIISNWSATNKLFEIGEGRIINNSNEITEILYVGWLEKEKGIKELIEAVKTIYSNNKSVRLTLVGDGKIRKYVENFIIKNRLNEIIKIKGWLSSKQIEKQLRKSNIFILPSWKEGMPNALIEALAAGLPVITTSVGVICDYLVNDSSAIIIKPKKVNNITKSLEKLINDYNLRRKLSKKGFLVAKTNFSTETSLKKLSKIISETLN